MIDAQNKTTTLYSYQNGIGANTEAILNRTLRHILYGDLYSSGGSGVPPNEMHFTTLAGSVDYVGTQGDQIFLSDGSIVDITITDATVTFNAPAGRHIVKLVESVGRHNYVSVGGGALVELHNFPTLSTVTKFNFSTYAYNPATNLTKVPEFFPSNIIDIKELFSSTTNFNQDISMWDVSNVKIFDYALSFNQLFNQPLNSWDVSGATSMAYMFYMAKAFNQPLNNWNVSNVTNMYNMFFGTDVFNQPLSNWNVSNVGMMAEMFKQASSFNQDISMWNVSNVTNMFGMFRFATSFNQPLNNWNVSNVTNMSEMFYSAQSFNQDLSKWCVTNITSAPINFDLNATNWTLPRPVWGTCPAP